MATTLQLNASTPVAGLDTCTYTVLADGEFKVSCQSTIPHDAGGTSLYSSQTSPFKSALQIVINLNGSPVVTVGGASNNPTPSQPQLAAVATIEAEATDVITVVLSSANAADKVPNAVKSIVNLFQLS